jgi:hypothetical protein
MPRSVLDKMAAIQMIDVHLPTTDGRAVVLSRYSEPELDQVLVLQRLDQLARPTAAQDHNGRHSDNTMTVHSVVPTLRHHAPENPIV